MSPRRLTNHGINFISLHRLTNRGVNFMSLRGLTNDGVNFISLLGLTKHGINATNSYRTIYVKACHVFMASSLQFKDLLTKKDQYRS